MAALRFNSLNRVTEIDIVPHSPDSCVLGLSLSHALSEGARLGGRGMHSTLDVSENFPLVPVPAMFNLLCPRESPTSTPPSLVIDAGALLLGDARGWFRDIFGRGAVPEG